MVFEQGKDAKIKMQEHQIRELKYALEQMQNRADAIRYLLEEEGETIPKYTINSMIEMLAPMEQKNSRTIFRKNREVHISSTEESRWFQQHRIIDAEIERKEMKQINTLYEYLQGNLPDGVKCFAPKLSEEDAFSVIWFLQECINCLPQKHERCSICGEIYNSENEGHYSELNGESYCGGCWDGDAPVTLCWDCGDDIFTEDSWSDEYGEYLCEKCKKERDEQEKETEE
jgi:hypothetical protein